MRPQTKLGQLAAAAAIALAVIIAYFPALRGGFVFDDTALIHASSASLLRVWRMEGLPDFLPLTWTTFWLEWRLWGENALGYHATNLALHAVAAILLWRTLRDLRVPGAWLAGLLFAVHPATVESVAWISERKNTLSAVLFLGAIQLWCRFDRTGLRRDQVLSLLLFSFALLSKSSVVMLPVVLLGIVWSSRGRLERRDLLRTMPYFLVAFAAGLATIGFQHERAIGGASLPPRGALERLGGAGWALTSYLEASFVPIRLGFLYPEWPVPASSPSFFVPLALVVLGFAVVWRRRTGWGRPLLLGLGYHAVMLLPVLGLLDMAFLQFSPVSNHLQYLALIGPIALVAAAIEALRARTAAWLARGVALLMVLLAGAASFHRAAAFESDLTLWQAAVREQPRSPIARYELAMYLLQNDRREEAVEQLEAMARVTRDPALQHRARTLWLLQVGRYAEAAAEAREAEQIRRSPEFMLDAGRQLARAGATSEAISLLAPLVAAAPLEPEYAYWLAVALSRAGRHSEAANVLERACGTSSDDPRLEEALSIELIRLGRHAEARRHFAAARHLAPDDQRVEAQLVDWARQVGISLDVDGGQP
jgi:tetratricopeptide (TPR) repeat protein